MLWMQFTRMPRGRRAGGTRVPRGLAAPASGGPDSLAGSRPAARSIERGRSASHPGGGAAHRATRSRRSATSSRRGKTRRSMRSTAGSPSDSTVSATIDTAAAGGTTAVAIVRARSAGAAVQRRHARATPAREPGVRAAVGTTVSRRRGAGRPGAGGVLAALLSLRRRPRRQLRAGHLAPSVVRVSGGESGSWRVPSRAGDVIDAIYPHLRDSAGGGNRVPRGPRQRRQAERLIGSPDPGLQE